MINDDFSLSKKIKKSLSETPSFRFRDKDPLIHNCSDAAKDSRQVVYKALGYQESNPADFLGQMRMRFGSWIENGLKYDIMSKLAPYGIYLLSTQGDAGEHGTFYGTSYHGYRDFDLGIKMSDGKIKPVIVELKTKVGYGAQVTLKDSPWSKKYKIPEPDQDWGYSQQISLYLRDAYNKTKDNPKFSAPIVDGIMLQFLFGDGLATFVEYYFEYLPEKDETVCYRVHCEDFPECCGKLDIHIKLKDIADRWKKQDDFIKRKELPPPDYQRKYDVTDPRVKEATKTDLTKATQNKKLIGDIQAAYNPYRDLEAEQLKIPLTYTPAEIKILKQILNEKD